MSAVAELDRLTKELGIGPNELRRFVLHPRQHMDPMGSTRDKAAVYEAQRVAELLKVTPAQLLKSLGISPTIGGSSFLRGTSVETLYTSHKVGTQLNTFTTEDNLMKTLPECVIPAVYFYDAKDIGKSLRVKAIGRLGSTSTPTFTFTLRLNTTSAYTQGAGVAVSSAAITAGSGVTLAPFFIDIEIVCQAIAQGAAGMTLAILGEVRSGTGFAAGGGLYSIPAANTTFTVTLDHSVTQYLYLSVACGTSNSLNLAQLELMKVYGEN